MNYSLQRSRPVMNHDMVCPSAVEPLFKQMVNKFIDDRAQPEAIAVGLNTTREICLQMLLDKEKNGSCKILARKSKQIRGHAYQLNPNAPKERVDKRKYYEQKFGRSAASFLKASKSTNCLTNCEAVNDNKDSLQGTFKIKPKDDMQTNKENSSGLWFPFGDWFSHLWSKQKHQDGILSTQYVDEISHLNVHLGKITWVDFANF